jgi:hypothetical protein
VESAFIATAESIYGYLIQVSATSGSFEIYPAATILAPLAFPQPSTIRSPRREIPHCVPSPPLKHLRRGPPLRWLHILHDHHHQALPRLHVAWLCPFPLFVCFLTFSHSYWSNVCNDTMTREQFIYLYLSVAFERMLKAISMCAIWVSRFNLRCYHKLFLFCTPFLSGFKLLICLLLQEIMDSPFHQPLFVIGVAQLA